MDVPREAGASGRDERDISQRADRPGGQAGRRRASRWAGTTWGHSYRERRAPAPWDVPVPPGHGRPTMGHARFPDGDTPLAVRSGRSPEPRYGARPAVTPMTMLLSRSDAAP